MHPVHPLHLGQWIRTRDSGLLALRRAARTAIVMPAMFALGDKVFHNPTLATFAAFGSFAMLLLVDFGGPMRERLIAQAGLVVVGAGLIGLGTLAARDPWVEAVSMAVVGFCVLFAGVVSSVLAGATTSLLLAFILSVSLPGPVSSAPDRMAGWGLAGVVAWLAVALLWPAPTRYPLRRPAAAAARTLARRLRLESAIMLSRTADRTQPDQPDQPEPLASADHAAAVQESLDAVAELRRTFLATAYRPTGLSTADRSVVRLVDELGWLSAIVSASGLPPAPVAVHPEACAVRSAVATVLERGADLLEEPSAPTEPLDAALSDLRQALVRLEGSATIELPVGLHHNAPGASDSREVELVTSLEPSFRSQEMSYAASQIASNIALAAAAERRTWLERLLGRQPAGLGSTFSAAQERAAAHAERHSVWLHNSLRGAAGLGLAVLVAGESGVQHSFWVVLGTLSVLRSRALNTGLNVARGLLGTLVGFVVGAGLLALIGDDTRVLWLLLPPAILLAGVAPAVISFAAGQAGFTLTIVILFNIIQPVGWRVGLLRVEDVALGCAVSLVVGLLFWPRGAAAALGRALAEAYSDSASYVAAAVTYGLSRCQLSTTDPADQVDPPHAEAARAAASARRLDDTFRNYLAEGGSKPVPLAEVATLVTGVVGLRLAADAVLELWQRADAGGSNGADAAVGADAALGLDRTAARDQLLQTTAGVQDWYDALASNLLRRGPVPEPLPRDLPADARLIEAVRHDLRAPDGRASSTAVRMIWTGDHLDAIRRLQASLAGPAAALDRR